MEEIEIAIFRHGKYYDDFSPVACQNVHAVHVDWRTFELRQTSLSVLWSITVINNMTALRQDHILAWFIKPDATVS